MLTKMIAGQYINPNTIKVSSKETPNIVENEALIKISYTGICGTDMMIYSGDHPRAETPIVMGHEFSGVVEKIYENSKFKVGDRVVIEPTISCGYSSPCKSGNSHICENLKLIGIDMDGGFAEYACVPINRLHSLPESLPLSLSALTEPVAVAVHSVRRSKLKVGQDVAILGAGPIGLLIGLIAQINGANNIYISDISSFRLNIAKKLGFQTINAQEINPVESILEKTNGNLMDVVFEVAGTQTTVEQMIDLIRTQGEIVIVSVFKHNPNIRLADMHFRELSINTTRVYTSDDFDTALNIINSEKRKFSTIISHELPLDQIEEGFSLMKNPDESLKVLIKS